MSNKICLCMIERDEAKVLPRSLGSFRALSGAGCDLCYAIADGGSADASMQVIEQMMAGIPGDVVVQPQPRPLDDFAKARNGAIALASPMAPWMWHLDADDEICMVPGFQMPKLTGDAYKVLVKAGSDEWWRPVLVRSELPWRYVGRMHENLECEGAKAAKELQGIWIQVHPGEGARSLNPQQKFLNDAAVLRKCLEEEPGNLRHLFYLAQSLRDAGDLEASLAVYQDRCRHTEGWAEETYFALLQVAKIKSWLKRPILEVTAAFIAAHAFRPTRAESFGLLALFLRENEQWEMARFFAEEAMRIPRPKDTLFVTREWYDWRAADEFAISAYWAGDYRGCEKACRLLLESRPLPHHEMERVRQNLAFAQKALGKEM